MLRRHRRSGLDAVGRDIQESIGEREARLQCPGNDGW